jgi:hypothetical protein
MTDTHVRAWYERPPGTLTSTVYGRPCGWHVILSSIGKTIPELLRPEQLGKSCVPYRVDPTTETLRTQAEALAIGLCNITACVREECPNL